MRGTVIVLPLHSFLTALPASQSVCKGKVAEASCVPTLLFVQSIYSLLEYMQTAASYSSSFESASDHDG